MKSEQLRSFLTITRHPVFIPVALLMALVICSKNAFAIESRPARILIKPKSANRAPELEQFNQSKAVHVFHTFSKAGDLQILELPATKSPQAAIAEYQASGLVEFAELDQVGHATATFPNDPKFLDGTLWALNNTGQSGGTPHADIDAPAAWDLQTSASNVIIAVLDTGVRYTHEDLASNMWVNPNDGSHGWNALGQNSDPSDAEVHGTMVAGVLGAVGNNGKGVTGVAWKCQIMACKCFNSSGAGNVSDVLICMDYAQTNGARIINASFGFAASAALSNAVLALRDAGVIVVAACGNSSTNVDMSPTYPACYNFDNVVSVAYTTRNDALAAASNYGATNVHLAAPGQDIFTTFPATDSFYFSNSGSSFAAPFVSGALALVMARFPSEPYQLAVQRVLDGVDPLPSLAGKCVTGGRLNLRKALSPPIRLTAHGLAGGAFQLRVTAGPNRSCTVQSTTDLVNWSPLVTNTTSTAGYFDFRDPAFTVQTNRFYRAVSTP